ncbi:AAA family ATPase [Streptomyces sp. NPDC088747]|uniref:AAA family ATPase n=1 Tax=Streptomyces sp. NPDC088747 TaxID=3365886 RepID=UPI0037F84D73
MLVVVIGPPCGGKSSWVREHAERGDIVIDYDRIANALAAEGPFEWGFRRPFAKVAYEARQAAINEALRHIATLDVYVIHSVPRPAVMDRYRKCGAKVVVVDPGREVVEARCREERPADSMDAVKRWYSSGLRPRPVARTEVAPATARSRKW